MAFEDIVLKYKGFNPSEFTDSHLSAVVRGIYEKSPYGCSLKAVFSQNEKMFKGVIKITSSAGSFFATATGPVLNEVTHKMFDKIRSRLDRWKSSRVLGIKGKSIKQLL